MVGSAPQGQKREGHEQNVNNKTEDKDDYRRKRFDTAQRDKGERKFYQSISSHIPPCVEGDTPSYDEHGNLLLFCYCCMDDRCGTICRHKFHVFEKYLAELGYTDFDYRSVHCLNWSAYAFLGARTVSEMNEEQKNTWGTYQQLVETGFAGTPCFHPTKPQKDDGY